MYYLNFDGRRTLRPRVVISDDPATSPLPTITGTTRVLLRSLGISSFYASLLARWDSCRDFAAFAASFVLCELQRAIVYNKHAK
jgi:hypothetical protein